MLGRFSNLKPARCRAIAAFLIIGAAVLRLTYLSINCPIDLVSDEAHYWDWSRHLDWSYYSKGPLVAWIIRGSCELFGSLSVRLTGSEMLAVRIPAVVFGALLLISLYILTVQTLRRESLALAVVAVASTVPLVSAGAVLMTIDAPYVCLWGWALVVGHKAVFGGTDTAQPRNSKIWIWVLLGLIVGAGILAKYTMVLFVPFLGLFLLATPAMRPLLRSFGFWIMTFVAAVCCSPIVIWNWQHDWVTLRHTAGQANRVGGLSVLGPIQYLGVQFAVLLGFWFVAWAAAICKYRPGRETKNELLYLWWLSAPMFVFFWLFSFKDGGGEPNWPVTAYVSGSVLAAGYLATEMGRATPLRRRLLRASAIAFCVLGLMGSIVAYRSSLVQPLLVRIVGPPRAGNELPLRKVDPTTRLRGWRHLAGEVDTLRNKLRADGVEPIVAATSWRVAGELAFYCEGHPTVYSLGSAFGDRRSQYDLWRPNPLADPDDFPGRTMIIADGSRSDLVDAFETVEDSQLVQHFEGGQPIAQWNITVARGYHGFPVTDRTGPY